jgi:hypothetical protein
MRVVVTLTTLPSRVTRNLIHALNDMKSQTRKPDAIYLNLPNYSVREKRNYETKEIDKHLDDVTVLRGVPDDGPITKLLPVLDAETDPETMIVVIDDDTRYNHKMIENLVKYSDLRAVGHCARNPAYHGNEIGDLPVTEHPKEPTRVAFLETVSGVMYQRGCFDSAQVFRQWMEKLPKDSKYVDDILIGAWLHKRNIDRWLVPCDASMWAHDNSAPSPLAPVNLTWRNTYMYNRLYRKGYYKGCLGTKIPKLNLLPILAAWMVVAGLSFCAGISLLAAHVAQSKQNKNKE